MKYLRSLLPSLFLMCLLASCASKPAQWPRSGVFRGTGVFGFEHSDFTPEGSRELWWLSGAVNKITDQMNGMKQTLHNPLLIVVDGELSKEGHYGHLGLYRRELRVKTVLDVSSSLKKSKWD